MIIHRDTGLGLLLVTCDTEQITGGDELALDLEQGLVRNLTRRVEIPFQPLPALMRKIVQAEGVIPFLGSDEGRVLL